MLAVLVRIILATVIFIAGWEKFFGGDATTYDIFGKSLLQSWHGDAYHSARYAGFIKSGAGAWGMLYVVAGVYQLIGENRFAIQLINASVGASSAVVVYYVAQSLFNNVRVSRVAAVLVAFFPSLILWSSQALKDGLIILALALGEKEMLGVENDFIDPLFHECDGIGDKVQVGFLADSQIVAHVHVPGLTH